MGERTRALIGTADGIATVHVYSANPKTADGYNAFIFRREVERSWRKLAWAPVIDARGNPLPQGIRIGDKTARYTVDEKRKLWTFVREQAKTQYGTVENADFGAFSIGRTFANEVQCHAISTRRELEAVSSAHELAENLVHFAASVNEEMKAKKAIKYFEYGLAKVRLSDGLYLLLGEVGVQVGKRPYYDQRVVAKFKADSEVTFLHERSRIGESAFEHVYDNRFRLIMQGVELYRLQKSGHVTFNLKNAKAFLAGWLSDKKNIVLVTGKTSYAKCGAEAFFAPLLAEKNETHLTTVGENARKEDVDEKKAALPGQIDAFIAVGGGTVIDTTKLLRGFSGVPFLAVPTTAGTGAEATRFAVYYDHGKKMSADDVRYLPTDQVLIPEFCESASAYLKDWTIFG